MDKNFNNDENQGNNEEESSTVSNKQLIENTNEILEKKCYYSPALEDESAASIESGEIVSDSISINEEDDSADDSEEVPEEEIDALLEEGLEDKAPNKNGEMLVDDSPKGESSKHDFFESEDISFGCPVAKKARYSNEEQASAKTTQYSIQSSKASGGAENALGPDIPTDLHLIDEVAEDSSEGEMDEESLYDSEEVPEDEIDALLEEGLPDEMKGTKRKKNTSAADNGQTEDSKDEKGKNVKPIQVKKTILIEKIPNHFEVLPEGWIEINHSSGMPVYLHKESRVCTFSRPYFLGAGSARKHTVPLTAIPCLKYIRDIEQLEKEKEAKSKERNAVTQRLSEQAKQASEDDLSSLPPGPLASALAAHTSNVISPENQDKNLRIADTRVETVVEATESQSLTAEELKSYCEKKFEFQTITVLRFPYWREKRQYQRQNRPQLPKGTKLISLRTFDDNSGFPRKQWVLNPKGKSHICILHEYVQHVIKSQPTYEFKEVENATNPYSASLSIDGVKYCTGYGSSKKMAKLECAKATLEILVPELGKKIRDENNKDIDADLSFFDDIRIEDPRVPVLCNKTSELSPFTVLQNCLQRNHDGGGNQTVSYKLVTNKHKKNEFIMTVGKHTVQVACKNKKDGKQRASQAILQRMHKHVPSWGGLLRLYGNCSLEAMRQKKSEEQQVTHLQTNATLHQPNTSIINKLKEEMLKLRDKNKTVQPIGKFIPPGNILPPNSATDLNNVDL